MRLYYTDYVIRMFFASLLGIMNFGSPWTLMATGDVIPARSVNYQMTAKNDFLWAIRNIAPLLKSADITLVNMESPLIKNCPLTNTGMVFCGDQRFVQALNTAGVDVVNLANNHSLNYGWEGLKETEDILTAQNIETTGTTSQGLSKKVIKNIKGMNIGFLGYTIVGKTADKEALASDIGALDKQVDVLVVSFHWGAEYNRMPVGAPDNPKVIGRLAVESGADLVIGNHPHWIQGMEYYQGKPIFYALGNTIFDQEWSRETKEGVITEIRFNGKTIENIIMHPVRISDYGHAELLDGKDKEDVLNVFQDASNQLSAY